MAFTPVMISDTELAGNLKNVYSAYRQELYPLSTPTFAQIKKEGRGGPKNLKWGGNGVYFDLVANRAGGWSSSTAGNLPDNHQVTEKQGFVGIKRIYITKAIDGLTEFGTDSKQAAFVSIGDRVMNELEQASSLAMEEILNGDALGIVAVIGTATDDTHSTVSKPYGYLNSGAATTGQGGLWLTEGEVYAVRSSNGVTLRGRAKVLTITNTGDNAAIVWGTGLTGTQAGDIIVRCTPSDDSYNDYPNGLGNILNRGGGYASLHNQTPTNIARWNTTRLVAGTDTGDPNQINEMDLWFLAARVGASCGLDPEVVKDQYFFHGTKGLEQQLIQNGIAQRTRVVEGGKTMKINGDYTVTSFSGVPYITSSYSPCGEVKMVHIPSLFWVDRADFVPVTFDGLGDARWIDGKDAFSLHWKCYMNVGTIRRNAHGMIWGFTDNSRFSPVM
jgi:hypothetical protein